MRGLSTLSTKATIPVPVSVQVASATVPVVPASTTSGGCSSYLSLFEQYNWNVNDAIAICNAESSGNPNASHYNSNGTTDFGLMEINSVHSALVNGNLQSLYNPAINIATAYTIYSQDGWQAWSTAWVIGL